ncbi:MAG: RNA polymerase sigma factor RpoD/SigA [Treponema sp.]|jgi:RNA polymerase primary sigma factor|nr:RNA polymerase sigma factor RpoD/SigA [Treponema sp.]
MGTKKNQGCENGENILQTYFNQIKAFHLLNFDEELELARRIQTGDSAALHELINANLRLVVKIARHFAIPDSSFMDIIQEGNLGLIHAAEKYDPSKKVRFCTYANWWIRQFISRYLVNKNRVVRLPHRKEELLRKIRYTYHSLSQALMHQPRSEEIAEELGISSRDVDYIVNISSGPLPLENDTWDEDTAVIRFHEDYTYSPEQILFRKFSREGTMRALDKLKDKEKRVLIYRYQLDGSGPHTLKKIGDAMGISPETVRQIELKAIKKIRGQAQELKDEVYPEAI